MSLQQHIALRYVLPNWVTGTQQPRGQYSIPFAVCHDTSTAPAHASVTWGSSSYHGESHPHGVISSEKSAGQGSFIGMQGKPW